MERFFGIVSVVALNVAFLGQSLAQVPSSQSVKDQPPVSPSVVVQSIEGSAQAPANTENNNQVVSKTSPESVTAPAPTISDQQNQNTQKPVVPTTVINPYSNPDYSVIEKLTNSLNKKNFDEFASVFSTDFEFITTQDKLVKTSADLRKFWDELFASKSVLEKASIIATPGNIVSPVQGFAYVVSPYKFTTNSEAFDGVFTTIMKFEAGNWKISEMQMASHSLASFLANKEATVKCDKQLEEYRKSSMGLVFPAFLGFIVGVGLMYFYRQRKQPAA